MRNRFWKPLTRRCLDSKVQYLGSTQGCRSIQWIELDTQKCILIQFPFSCHNCHFTELYCAQKWKGFGGQSQNMYSDMITRRKGQTWVEFSPCCFRIFLVFPSLSLVFSSVRWKNNANAGLLYVLNKVYKALSIVPGIVNDGHYYYLLRCTTNRMSTNHEQLLSKSQTTYPHLYRIVPYEAMILYRESKSWYVAGCFWWEYVRTKKINIIEFASVVEPQNDFFIILKKVWGEHSQNSSSQFLSIWSGFVTWLLARIVRHEY